MKTAFDCYRHAIRRATERYGVFFTMEDMRKLSLKVQNKQALYLQTESRSRTHWLLEDQYIVVYNKNLKAITTFLPPDCIMNYLPSNKVTDSQDDHAPQEY